MKKQIIIFFLQLIIIINVFASSTLEEGEDPQPSGSPEELPYLGRKEYTLSPGQTTIFLKLDVTKIKQNSYTFISLIQNDPTYILSFKYKYITAEDKEDDDNNYILLNNNGVLNNFSEHTIYYRARKTLKNSSKLLLKIEVSVNVEGKKLTVVNTQSQTNLNLIIIIILVVSSLISTSILIGFLIYIKNQKRNPNDINNSNFPKAVTDPVESDAPML